jgi:hypothetical protein
MIKITLSTIYGAGRGGAMSVVCAYLPERLDLEPAWTI